MDVTSVLIVDDHELFRSSTRSLLERAGYEVVGEAADGTTALCRAAVLEPDAVLLDVQLPDISGFTVSRRLCEGSDPPLIVLVSSRDASDYGGSVSRSGAAGFISKDELSAESFARVVGGA